VFSIAGVLKILSLAGGYGIVDEDLVLPKKQAIVDSESMIGRCTQPANSQLIPQSSMKYLGLARYSLAERD
jgi:hypothetical protein